MARRPRRFDDGGDVREGPHKGIDDDTRARALAAVRRNMERADLESLGADVAQEAPKAPQRRTAAVSARPAVSSRVTPPAASSPAPARTKVEKTTDVEARERRDRGGPYYVYGKKGVEQSYPELDSLLKRGRLPYDPDRDLPLEQHLVKPQVEKIAKDRAAKKRAELISPAQDEAFPLTSGSPHAKGGKVKKYANGGTVSASRRADGIAQRGKTRGKVC